MVSKAIVDKINMNQFEDNKGEEIKEFLIKIQLNSDIEFTLMISKLKLEKLQMTVSFACNIDELHALIEEKVIIDLNILDVVRLENTNITSKTFTSAGSGVYLVELVVSLDDIY